MPPLAQNKGLAAVLNQYAIDMREQGQAYELFADEPQIALSPSSSKAYDDLIGIMPQLGLALRKRAN